MIECLKDDKVRISYVIHTIRDSRRCIIIGGIKDDMSFITIDPVAKCSQALTICGVIEGCIRIGISFDLNSVTLAKFKTAKIGSRIQEEIGRRRRRY